MFGLVNICIVEKITKFDNEIFLAFRAAGESFADFGVSIAKNEIWDLKANVIIQDMEFFGVVKMEFSPNMDKILMDDYSGGMILGDLVAENWPSKFPYIRNEVKIENVYGLNMIDTNFNGSINDFSDDDKLSLRKYGAIID